MNARRPRLSRCRFALATASLFMLLLAGCSSPTSGDVTGAPEHDAPPANATPMEAAAYYFEGVRLVDSADETHPTAYWRVETDTTPTVDGATTALAYMGKRYGDYGKAVVLRIDVDIPTPRTKYDSNDINLCWNPTDSPVVIGLTPPDRLAPHELAAWVVEGPPVMSFDNVLRVPQVPTNALVPGTIENSTLAQQLRTIGLR